MDEVLHRRLVDNLKECILELDQIFPLIAECDEPNQVILAELKLRRLYNRQLELLRDV